MNKKTCADNNNLKKMNSDVKSAVLLENFLIWFLCQCNENGINCVISSINSCIVQLNGREFTVTVSEREKGVCYERKEEQD